MNRTPKILGVTLANHFTFGRDARVCVERASRALNVWRPSWVELFFSTESLVATYVPGHRLPHPKLRCSHMVHPRVLNIPGQTWCDPEQGSDDRNRLPSKAAVSHLRAENWVLSLRVQQLSAVLCQRPPTYVLQSSNSHLPSQTSPPQGYPTGLKPKRSASKRWRPQRPSSQFWLLPGRGRFPLGQAHPTRPDD